MSEDKNKVQEKTPSQQQAKPATPPKAPSQSSEVKGSIDKSYKMTKQEDGLVHFKLTDFASPRSRDLNKDFKPIVRIVKTTPEMFVRQFAGNFEANDAFTNVNTPGLIARLHENLDKKHIESAYEDEIHLATVGRPKLKAEWIKNRLEQKQILKLVGGNQVIKKGDILHIPTNDDNFPFNPKDLNKFPEECMY